MTEPPLFASPPRLPTIDAAILVVLAVVVLAVLAIAASSAHSGDDSTAAVATGGSQIAVTQTAPATDTDAVTDDTDTSSVSQEQTPAAGDLTDSDLHGLLDRYVTAYADEDTIALEQLMSPDIVRESAGQPTRVGITAVLREYMRQFDANGTTGYKLDAPEVARADGAATLATRYTITTTNAPTSTGAITLHVVRGADGDVVIDHISVLGD